MFEDADKFLKIAVGLGILAAGFGVGYHYGIYVPQHEREQIAAAEQSKIETAASAKAAAASAKVDYDECVSNAYSAYRNGWNSDCKLSGMDKKSDGCSLPAYQLERWNKYLEDEKANCLDIYKTQLR